MGKADAIRWLENQYFRRYLCGRADVADLSAQYSEVREKIFLPDVVADATEPPVAPAGDLNIRYHAWIDEDLVEIVNFTRWGGWAFDWAPKIFLRAHFYRKEAAVLLIREFSARH